MKLYDYLHVFIFETSYVLCCA